ncbi:MAG: ParB/RepB/Spo0J family partition protein [Nitrososphaera sp.]
MEFVDSSIVEQIEMKMIRSSQFSIRDKFQKNDCDFETLVNSIREHGLLQPILIRPLEHGFEIVAGHRRFQACRTLRWRFVTAKIRELSDKQTYEIQLTENIQRKSMDPIEEAEAFRRYVVDFGWGGVSELAKKIGKSEEYVSHHMQLLKLPDEIKDRIMNNSLRVSQAIEIVQVPPDRQQKIASEIINNNLTVRQIRELKLVLSEEATFSKNIACTRAESRSHAIAKKSSLTLRITLARLDNLINEVHTTIEPDQRAEILNLLMGLRLSIHSLIDESIRFRNKRPN